MPRKAGEPGKVPKTEFNLGLSRRRVLGLGLAAAALFGLAPLPAAARTPRVPQKMLSFRNVHNRETLTVVYWANGRYVPSGLKKISRLLRDHRTNQVRLIDPRLLDQLYDLKTRLRPNSHFEVFSGYRSPASNARLRRVSRGVAKNSLHMRGQAVDVKLAGVRPSTLAKAARKMERGGVGYYRRFVHLDTGDVRTWRG